MKALFVTPSDVSSGEAITSLAMAESILGNGGQVRFLASSFSAGFLQPYFGRETTLLTHGLTENQERWYWMLKEFEPDAIIFADYPFLFFPTGISPLADDGWCQALEQTSAAVITLDHLGYAQKAQSIFFGPPHLSMQSVSFPPLPEAMQILLPCPGQSPGPVANRRGTPFRYWELPFALPEPAREAVRSEYGIDGDGCLIFHSVSGWALRFAKHFRLPFYDYLSRFFDYYLEDSPRSVTIVSINSGQLLQPLERRGLRIANLSALPRDDYEQLMFSADFMLTENRISVSLGKMVCSLTPCAVLRNSYRLVEALEKSSGQLRELIVEMERLRPGAIFPYEVFPIWGKAELEELRICEDNSLYEGVASLELFGGEETRRAFQELLFDPGVRAEWCRAQEEYVHELQTLPASYAAITAIVEGS